jgi:hypothetical protein
MPETHVVPFDPDSDSDSDPDFLPPSGYYLSNSPRVTHFADDIPTRGRHFVHFVNILVLDGMPWSAAIPQQVSYLGRVERVEIRSGTNHAYWSLDGRLGAREQSPPDRRRKTG